MEKPKIETKEDEPNLMLEVSADIALTEFELCMKALQKKEIALKSKAPVTQEYIDRENKARWLKVKTALVWLKENFREACELRWQIERYKEEEIKRESQQKESKRAQPKQCARK